VAHQVDEDVDAVGGDPLRRGAERGIAEIDEPVAGGGDAAPVGAAVVPER
jgi:hypothetical protein